ncbi:hypothetical protein BDY19DRAFT_1084186 [Irpex rosettiformis]|uniref:Uncharacterized protein n=1 Tax=Irpex rosettiformis TaxID=378272 RepID=A0ACB8UC85_9APHY|nr:hypothetical protein BDY19DRAFT_1084186 [Irpex rosettiformis]
MSGTRLPAVRIPQVSPGHGDDEDSTIQDSVMVDVLPSSKFGFAWPAEQPNTVPIPLATERQVTLSSSDGETDISEEELSAPLRRQSRPEGFGDSSEFTTPTNNLDLEQNPLDVGGLVPPLPHLSRAFSMPLPSQLGSLQHPRRPSASSSFVTPFIQEATTELEHFRELSLELADSVQMVIQTLLQLSPPQVLDPVKEQFSACSLSIPTPSISAMFTCMKNLNYMSANMSALSMDTSNTSSSADTPPISRVQSDFDVGEMLQSVGDALGGMASQAGIDLVLFHGDIGMKHIPVKGDENGLSYTLSHVIRQVVACCKRGDTVEVGLQVFGEGVLASGDLTASHVLSPSGDTCFRCKFQILHQFTGDDHTTHDTDWTDSTDAPRLPPTFDSLILRRLLRHIGATLDFDTNPQNFLGRSYEMSILLEPGAPSVVDPTVTVAPEDAAVLGFPDMQISNEPSLEELVHFAETLRGKSVTLHASTKGSFAHHLSSYLTAWGMSVSHMSTEIDADGEYELVGEAPEPPLPAIDLSSPSTTESSASTPTGPRRISSNPVFILIDDDVAVLQSRLQKIKAEQAYPLHLHGRKRPSYPRQRSSPQVARVIGMSNNTAQAVPQVVIVHFTSLSNFKRVKDAIQSILTPANGSSLRIPEVIVIPKPAGPRRFLTALHTAVTRPVVDPFFTPTATSPMSPGLHGINPFFSLTGVPRSPGGRSTASARTSSDKSTKSPKEFMDAAHPYAAPPSPLGQPDNMEYFSDAAAKLGNSPATGLLIQSPDGQPTGIFFHPRPKSGNPPASPSIERDRPQGSRDVCQRLFARIPSGGEGATNVIVSPTAARPSPRVNNSLFDPHELLGSPRDKSRLSPSPFTEQTPPQSTEQILGSSGINTPDDGSAQRLLTRRESQQSAQSANSSPSSPQTRTTGGAGTARSSTRRPTIDSHITPMSTSKKGKGGPDGNIVPPISVLIVDDNPINQTILSTFMRKKKIKYDVAKNGEEAVHKWRSGVFHLILMDIQMPVMDGIQATKEIRKIEKSTGAGGFPSTPQSEGQRTPSEASTSDSRNISTPLYRSSVIIVALTASSLQADRVAALAAGCNDFLTKPVSLEWLNSKIIEWGSIKALQMWADIRPEVVKSITSGQNAQAQQVARRLHVPEGRSATPSGERSRATSMAGRRTSMDSGVERGQQTSSLDASFAGADPSRHAYSGMTASEAALGLASAHRPQLPVDSGRIHQEVVQGPLVSPPPEVPATSSSLDVAAVGTSATLVDPSVPSNDEKSRTVGMMNADPQPGPPQAESQ